MRCSSLTNSIAPAKPRTSARSSGRRASAMRCRRHDGEWDIFAKGPTRLGHDVWVGFGATILSGSTIGHGCVVGAGAVVAGSEVAPYSIVAGNPARTIGRRFDDRTVDRLLAVQWWHWPDEQITAMEPFFYSGIDVFLDESERRLAGGLSPSGHVHC